MSADTGHLTGNECGGEWVGYMRLQGQMQRGSTTLTPPNLQGARTQEPVGSHAKKTRTGGDPNPGHFGYESDALPTRLIGSKTRQSQPVVKGWVGTSFCMPWLICLKYLISNTLPGGQCPSTLGILQE